MPFAPITVGIAIRGAAESDDLANIIFKLRDKYKLSILLIEHDMGFVNKLCDRVLVLDYGKMIFEGDIREAVLNKDVISAYLGDIQNLEK